MTWNELQAVWSIKKELAKQESLRGDLQYLKAEGNRLNEGPPAKRPVQSRVETLAILLTECEATIAQLSELLAKRQRELLTKLQALDLPEAQRRVLVLRYVGCQRFCDLAKQLNLTRGYVNKLHTCALRRLGLHSSRHRVYIDNP